MFKKMADGIIAYGDADVLDLFDNVIKTQMMRDSKAKFKPNQKVRISVSKDKLIKYIESTGETYFNARNEAILLLSNDYGIVMGKVDCNEGAFYSVEFDIVPMFLLPENFLSLY